MRTRAIIGCFLVLAACAGSARAADFYASTTGTPAGDGSIGDPWDLTTALHHPPAVQPGDTIWVRGGTYGGAHTSRLAGAPGNPITVRAYRRERVILDYAGNTNCNPAETDECSPNNKRCNALTVPACSHDVVLRDLELANSTAGGRVSLPAGGCADAPECCYVDGVAPPLKPECGASPAGVARAQWQPLHIAGDRVTLVNCVVRDGGTGVGTDQQALDTEIYGALVFNNGWVDPASGQGHGVSLENLTPSWRPSRKRMRDSVLWNNFGDGARSATTWGHFSNNLFFEDVISFNNGAPAAAFYAGAPVLYAAAQETRYANLLLQADEKMRFIQLRRCRLYHSPDSHVQRQHLGGIRNADYEFNKDLIVEDSYIATSGTPLSLIRWDRVRTTGTTLVGGASPQAGDSEALVEIEKTECANSFDPAFDWNGLDWNDNDYYFTGADTQPFGLRTGASWVYRTFGDWRTAIYNRDALSSYNVGLPASNAIFVQPNEYEAGRAHVAVYNWLGLSAVGVDLSGIGLVAGQEFRIHNLQAFDTAAASDPFGTVVAGGIYDPGLPVVSVPMTDPTVTAPVGLGVAVASTLPQFGAFLVRGTPCGDGALDAGEACDDGNLAAGDGCTPACAIEPCWSCSGAPSSCSPESAGTACAADGNVCTDDVCDGAGSCGVDNTASCDDGLFCTGADTCSGGTCEHAGDPCPAGGACQACNETTGICAAPAGTVCADDGNVCTDDVCDGAGSCGVDNADICDDGSVCTQVDTCSGSACVGSSPIVCADSNPCTQDSCNPVSGCVFAATPRPVCTGSSSLLLIKQNADDARDNILKWKWIKGSAALADFGAPTSATTTSTLCLYDQNGIVLRADVPGGQTCGGAPCWKATASGFKYKDTAAASSGIRVVVEKQSPDAKVVIAGKGLHLPDPATGALAAPVTAQFLNSSSSGCMQGVFAPGQVIRQDATQFKARNF